MVTPSRMLCNGVQREGAKLRPDFASELFCYVPLHNIRDGVSSTCIHVNMSCKCLLSCLCFLLGGTITPKRKSGW